MQKWCPEPFDDMAGPVAAVAGAVRDAEASFTANREAPFGQGLDRSSLFMSESRFQEPENLMAHLPPEERAQVYDLVAQDLRREYEEREKEMALAQATEMENARQGFDAALDQWSGRITEAQARHCKAVSEAAARITLILAEKVIRSKVENDPAILMRGLETALFKLDERRGITVVVHPEEAGWLESRPEVLAKLGIEQVQADRRIDKGGCLVRTDTREWDATLKGQLSYLNDLVEEMVATQEHPDLNLEDDTDVDPGLD